MILIYKRVDLPDGYVGVATPPHSGKENWVIAHPISRAEVLNRMLKLGCPGLDVVDALEAADANHFGYV